MIGWKMLKKQVVPSSEHADAKSLSVAIETEQSNTKQTVAEASVGSTEISAQSKSSCSNTSYPPHSSIYIPNIAFSELISSNHREEFKAISSYLRQTFQFKQIKDALLYQEIIAWHAQQKGVEVTPEEIQTEANQFRRQYHLEKASETLAWLREQQTSTEDFEEGLQKQVLRRKLAEHLFAQKAEQVFAENRLEYERAVLYQITFSSEALAYELLYRIQDKEISFFEVAHQFDTDEQRARRCGYVGEVSRWELKPDLAAAAFGTPIGELAGPLSNDQGWHLLLVERLLPAELSPSLHQKLIEDLFKHWLEKEKLRWLSNFALKPENYTITLLKGIHR